MAISNKYFKHPNSIIKGYKIWMPGGEIDWGWIFPDSSWKSNLSACFKIIKNIP